MANGLDFAVTNIPRREDFIFYLGYLLVTGHSFMVETMTTLRSGLHCRWDRLKPVLEDS